MNPNIILFAWAASLEKKKQLLLEMEEELEQAKIPGEILIPANVKGQPFTKREVLSLMKSIEKVVPIESEQWNEVLATHCKKYPGRTTKSFQRKLKDLQEKSISSDDPNCPKEVKMARRIQSMIAEKQNEERDREVEQVKKRYRREMEHPDCPEDVRMAKETWILIEEKKKRLRLQQQQKEKREKVVDDAAITSVPTLGGRSRNQDLTVEHTTTATRPDAEPRTSTKRSYSSMSSTSNDSISMIEMKKKELDRRMAEYNNELFRMMIEHNKERDRRKAQREAQREAKMKALIRKFKAEWVGSAEDFNLILLFFEFVSLLSGIPLPKEYRLNASDRKKASERLATLIKEFIQKIC
ncbi:unnamed protein product [Pseudo-nitzschia multistriata]|uniref:Uncharacterized protein n=1 Tax=Pseudo-nitzschia multistriata TaxID=183589 RepID=A0A448Z0F1_9STRA|nr:unnamed protein product [Pseudo-nitzschia multistriata]